MSRIIFQKYLRWVFLSICAGFIAGLSSALFLHSMNWIWHFQMLHHETLFFLPFAVLLISFVYQKFAKENSDLGSLVFEEIHEPKKVLPVRLAPLVFFGTLLSHLVGGSVGREGTAVQVSASLTDQMSKIFKITSPERKILLVAASGAGFGSAVGAPLAGIIFGMEMIYIGRLKFFAPIECMIASLVAFAVGVLLRAPHVFYLKFESVDFAWSNLFWVALAGATFGLTARLFIKSHHTLLTLLKKISLAPVLVHFLVAIVLCGLFYLEGSFHYSSLGFNEIQNALRLQVSFIPALYKFVFTILSLSCGLKGGEFVPLVFIGSHLGSALAAYIPVSSQLLAALGFAAVFAGAANVPITCSIMAIELFGWAVAPYALIACLMSYFCSGQTSIYRLQKATP